MNREEYLGVIRKPLGNVSATILLKEHASDIGKSIEDELIQRAINLGMIMSFVEGSIKYFDDKFEIVRTYDKYNNLIKIH